MSDTEDIQRELTGESQPDDEERGEVQTTSGESEAHHSGSETETVSESEAGDSKEIQRELTGESQPDDEERQSRQEELNWKLVYAAEYGKNEDVIQHISDGAEITSRNHRGDTGLHISARNGHKDVLQTFISNKADLNIRGDQQATPLISAAVQGKFSCAQLLLAHGADTDLRSGSGRTALANAAKYDFPDVISTLLAHGADDTIQDDDGRDALKWAENENNQDAIRMFKVWKERCNVGQEMMTAAEEGKWRLVTGLVIAGADVETRNARGETGLDLAIRSGNRDAVLAFLDKGVNGYNREECVQKCDENKERQRRQEELNHKLVWAANRGKNEDVIQHISDGAEITSRDSYGETGLHLSAAYGHKDVLQTFINHKADLNIRGHNQWTPLINAANGGRLSCAQLLLAHGANTDLQTASGMTALMKAAEENYPEIIAVLLVHGANDQIQDDYGRDALKFVKRWRCQDAIRMLTAWKESNVSQEMMVAAEEGRWRLVTGLIIAGADVETKNAQGETGLDLAIRSGNRDAVMTFLDKGVNVFNRGVCSEV